MVVVVVMHRGLGKSKQCVVIAKLWQLGETWSAGKEFQMVEAGEWE